MTLEREIPIICTRCWLESNAQGKITSIQIIFKTCSFQDFCRPSPSRLGRTFCRCPFTAKRRRGTHFCRWFGWPPLSLFWGCPGTARGPQVWLQLFVTEKSLLCQYFANRKAGGSAWGLRHHFRSHSEVALRTGSSSHYRNSSWDDNLDLFGLKIGWDVAGAFVMWAVLIVSPPGGDSNHDDSSLFRHFGHFFFFYSQYKSKGRVKKNFMSSVTCPTLGLMNHTTFR